MNQFSVILFGFKEDSMNKVAIVVSDIDEWNLIVAAPAGDMQCKVSFFVILVWKTSQHGCKLLDEMVLQVPAGTDNVDSFEDALTLGVFANCIFHWSELAQAWKFDEKKEHTVEGFVRDGSSSSLRGRSHAAIHKVTNSRLGGSINKILTEIKLSRPVFLAHRLCKTLVIEKPLTDYDDLQDHPNSC